MPVCVNFLNKMINKNININIFILTLVYMAFITYMSVLNRSGVCHHPGLGSGFGLIGPANYNALHLPGYGLLAFMLLSMFRNISPGIYIISFIVTMLFGAGNEFLQSFVPGRQASIDDIVRDLAGCIITFVIFSAIRYFRELTSNDYCSNIYKVQTDNV